MAILRQQDQSGEGSSSSRVSQSAHSRALLLLAALGAFTESDVRAQQATPLAPLPNTPTAPALVTDTPSSGPIIAQASNTAAAIKAASGTTGIPNIVPELPPMDPETTEKYTSIVALEAKYAPGSSDGEKLNTVMGNPSSASGLTIRLATLKSDLQSLMNFLRAERKHVIDSVDSELTKKVKAAKNGEKESINMDLSGLLALHGKPIEQFDEARRLVKKYKLPVLSSGKIPPGSLSGMKTVSSTLRAKGKKLSVEAGKALDGVYLTEIAQELDVMLGNGNQDDVSTNEIENMGSNRDNLVKNSTFKGRGNNISGWTLSDPKLGEVTGKNGEATFTLKSKGGYFYLKQTVSLKPGKYSIRLPLIRESASGASIVEMKTPDGHKSRLVKKDGVFTGEITIGKAGSVETYIYASRSEVDKNATPDTTPIEVCYGELVLSAIKQ